MSQFISVTLIKAVGFFQHNLVSLVTNGQEGVITDTDYVSYFFISCLWLKLYYRLAQEQNFIYPPTVGVAFSLKAVD